MKFCSQCGSVVEHQIPPGDHLPRFICGTCQTIHYENPKVIVGCVPEYQGKILLCKRAIEPRLGFWTIPAGFMENGETLEAGAARECLEEAQAHVSIGSLLAIVDVVHAHQVHVMFRAKLEKPEFGAGAESLEVGLYSPEEIPWSDIAFRSIEFALKRYLSDRQTGIETVHTTQFNGKVWHQPSEEG